MAVTRLGTMIIYIWRCKGFLFPNLTPRDLPQATKLDKAGPDWSETERRGEARRSKR